MNLPREVGVGYLRTGAAEKLLKFKVESLWREYRKRRDTEEQETVVATAGVDYLEPATVHHRVPADPETITGNGDGTPAASDPAPVTILSQPWTATLTSTAMHSTARAVTATLDPDGRPGDPRSDGKSISSRSGCGAPADDPLPIDAVVEMYRGKPWTQDYGTPGDLVFPIGIIDRPYKQDQQPQLVNAAGEGANVMVVGGNGSGKTTTLQTLVCSAALTHSPEAVQFYILALGSPALGSLAELPHVGSVAYALDEDGIRRTVAELMELLATRQRSFPQCGVNGVEQFRRRKFGGEPGPVPDDPYGDVFLVVDDFRH